VIHVARNNSIARRAANLLLLVLSFALVGTSASAGEPAVREANFRIRADYEWLHLFSDDVFVYTAPSTGNGTVTTPFAAPPTIEGSSVEVDIDDGGFTGVYTFPVVGEEYGARVFGGPRFGKIHADTFDETDIFGFDAGAEGFWRDPAFGEAGAGAFYSLTDYSTDRANRPVSGINGTFHTAGVTAYGKLFIGAPDAETPIDLDVRAVFSDSNIDDSGLNSADRTYGAIGGVTAYLNDHAAVRAGGIYDRRNLGRSESIETRAATIDLDLLVPTARNVILGAGVIVGKREEKIAGVQRYGRLLFGLRFEATISFTSAESLLELNRNLF